MSKNDEFCSKKEELCIKNEELYIKKEELGIKNDEFCSFMKNGPAQQQLKDQLPGLTVRVDGLPDAIHLGDEGALARQFSKYGTVIGVTISTRTGLLSASPGLPRQALGKILHQNEQGEGGSPGRGGPLSFEEANPAAPQDDGETEPLAMDGKVWCYVSFSTPEEAAVCCQHKLSVAFDTAQPGRVGEARAVKALATSSMFSEERDIGLFGVHEGRVLASRGTTSLPFRYTGEAIPEEGNPGAQLDRNHSHYILLDDSTSNQFGREVAFRGELLDFIAYRYDVSDMSVEHIVQQIRNRKRQIEKTKKGKAKLKWKGAVAKIDIAQALGGAVDDAASSVGSWAADMQRTVPVVCVVYNGGPYTMSTVMLHVNQDDPVLIIKGSGRAADLFTDWKELMDELDQHGEAFRSSIKDQVLRKQDVSRQAIPTTTWLP